MDGKKEQMKQTADIWGKETECKEVDEVMRRIKTTIILKTKTKKNL